MFLRGYIKFDVILEHVLSLFSIHVIISDHVLFICVGVS